MTLTFIARCRWYLNEHSRSEMESNTHTNPTTVTEPRVMSSKGDQNIIKKGLSC